MNRSRVKSDEVYEEILQDEKLNNPFQVEDKDKWIGSRKPTHRSVDAKEYFDSIRNNKDYSYSLESNPFNKVNSVEDIRNSLRQSERSGVVEQVKADIAASQSIKNQKSFAYVNEETLKVKPEELAGTEVYVDLDANAKRLYDNLRNGYTVDDFVRSNINEKRKMKLSQESKHNQYSFENDKEKEKIEEAINEYDAKELEPENLKSLEEIIESELENQEINIDLTHEYAHDLQIDAFNEQYGDTNEKTSIIEDILNSNETKLDVEEETKIEEILDPSIVETISNELDQNISNTTIDHLEYTRENENLIELIRDRRNENLETDLSDDLALVEQLTTEDIEDKKAKKKKKKKKMEDEELEPRRKIDVVIEIALVLAIIVLIIVALNQRGIEIPFLP